MIEVIDHDNLSDGFCRLYGVTKRDGETDSFWVRYLPEQQAIQFFWHLQVLE